MKFIKADFRGGLNLQFDPSRIAANEYPLMFNGRCRDGVIRPVKSPLFCENCPQGKYQGIYAANQYALLIAGGKAYIKNFEVGGNFNQVPGIQLDPNVDVIYAQAVPASTNNFRRVPASANKNGGVNLTVQLDQTLSGVVLNDGINQPAIILSDGTGRVLKTYEQWDLIDPEYVPVAKQMLLDSGILYAASPDGTLIYRSVTDRALNFMVNITQPNGDKQVSEDDGGAASVSHAIGVDPITCMSAMNTPENAFFVGTRKAGVMVIPDFDDTLFGEPKFSNVFVFPVGPVNQFSITETNGDYVFVTTKGIRSFNATLLLKNESRNTPFSKRIQRAFRNITQTNPAIGKFDDYIFFSVKTVYGDAVIVYDETLEQFVSIDQWAGVARVKQFATITTASSETMLFITSDNKLYEFERGNGSETCDLYVGDFSSQDPAANQKGDMLYVVVDNAESAGQVTVTPYVNRKKQLNTMLQEPIDSQREADVVPLSRPFGDDSKDNNQVIPFNIGRIEQGWKVGFRITLNCQADISVVGVNCEDELQTAALKNEVKRFARLNNIA